MKSIRRLAAISMLSIPALTGCLRDSPDIYRNVNSASGYDVHLWDMNNGEEGKEIRIGGYSPVTGSMGLSEDGLIYAVDSDGNNVVERISLYNLKPGSQLEKLASVVEIKKVLESLPEKIIE